MSNTSRSLSLREIYNVPVVDAQGRELGHIDDVLFHPSLPYAVGFSVKAPRLGGLIKLPEKYLPFSAMRINAEGLVEVDAKVKLSSKALWGENSTNEIDWDMTVIYYGQDVYTDKTSSFLGKLSDARFNLDTGEVSILQVSDGISSDLMSGKRSFSGSLVKGFNIPELRLYVDESVASLPFEGGAKEMASELGEKASVLGEKALEGAVKGAATATVYAEKGVEGAIKGVATATVYAEKGIKAALKTETGKKTAGFFKKFADEFKEGLSGDE